MKFNIDIEQFTKQFNKEYKFLYDNDDYVAGYREAVEAFDNFVAEHAEFVGEFVEYRRDFVSSDREAAAFMFAMEALANNFDLDKYVNKNPQSLLIPVYRGGHWIYEL
jgi:hypothetical protein|nr:MAG TPA: hypothetical protein [Caudoviricetes sp.]